MREVPFSKPFLAGTELARLQEAIDGGLSSAGPFTARCEEWLAGATGARRALLSHTGTGALEAAAMLAGLGPGDEAIMPSFGYPTMASAVVRQGARPVFVDIEPATLNIDPVAVEAAIGPHTKAVVAVHYGGVACDMAALLSICAAHGLTLIEDAAHGLLASYRGRALGAIGQLGTLSFHHTKNLTCGEGGCLLVNDPKLLERAEIVWEKGTDRGRYARGEVDRYSWIDVGSSFGASELTAAFLYSQLEVATEVTARRRSIWQRYHDGLAAAESSGLARRPVVPEGCEHNGHLYYLLLPTALMRDEFIGRLDKSGVRASFHYTPLHSSPAGIAYGRRGGGLDNTERISQTLVRLPLFPDLDDETVERVIELAGAALGACVESVAS
jgi:dTDP-4-amino-4,6-dideoxygalactose transaminase